MKIFYLIMNNLVHVERNTKICSLFENEPGIEFFHFNSIKEMSENIKNKMPYYIFLHESDMLAEEKEFHKFLEKKICKVIIFSGGIYGVEKTASDTIEINYNILISNFTDIIDDLLKTQDIEENKYSDTIKDSGTTFKSELKSHSKLLPEDFEIIVDILSRRKEHRILFVDDDLPKKMTNLSSDKVILCRDYKTAERLIDSGKFDLSIIDHDLHSREGNGLDLKEKIMVKHKNSHVILLTGKDDFMTIFSSLKAGIKHFISKYNFNRTYFKRILDLIDFEEAPLMIGKSKVATDMFEDISFYSALDDDILISGENGTGKELVARTVYHLRNYKGHLVTKNCAGIPETLFESEMFGYKEGAFTGALKGGKISPFEEAHNGIIFLDEIGELPATQQVKLLRAVQERQINHLGSNRSVRFGARIIYATNKNLRNEIRLGNFRQDFYYRISGCEIMVPALRERKEDIEMLASYFSYNFVKRNPSLKADITGIDKQSLTELINYEFPGNIRELEKIVNRSVVKMIMNKSTVLKFILPVIEKSDTFNGNEHKTDSVSIDLIIELLKSKIIYSKGLNPELKKKIIQHMSQKNSCNSEIATLLGLSGQSLRNLRSKLKI